MPSYRLATAQRDNAVNPVGDALNNGQIQIRTGAQPTNVADAAGGTLLSEHGFSATAFGAAATGVKTANAIAADTILASGTADHARFLTSVPAIHSDADVGMAGPSPSIVVDNDEFVLGGTATFTSLTMTCPIGT